MRVLVSGFGPFLEERINPTESIVNFVNSCGAHTAASAGWSALDVRGVILPVAFDLAFQRLEQERTMFKPDVILSFGLAGGRSTIDLEKVAVNARGAKNAGGTEAGPIDPTAPAQLATTLPVEMMLADLQASGIPARLSESAGTYVCNDLFFQTQRQLTDSNVRSGFIHVPRMAVPGEAESPTAWSWSAIEASVHSILSTIAKLKNAGRFGAWLDGTRQVLADRTQGANVPCGSCTACCRSSQFVHVRPDDVAALGRIPKSLLFPAPGAPAGHWLMGYDEKGECPMLIKDRCSIYGDRPQACRDYDCRIFPATGFLLNDVEQAAIKEAANRWTFEISRDDDRAKYASVQAAAKFLRDHRGLFPQGALPSHPARLAAIAIQIHGMFLNSTPRESPSETVTAILKSIS